MADSTGAQTMFILSTVFTCIYYAGISAAGSWYSFFFLQVWKTFFDDTDCTI